MIGIIGGTGLDSLAGMQLDEQRSLETPYGSSSAPLSMGEFSGSPVAFLPRHGQGHRLAPHAINYRANIWALREAGVRKLIAVAAVGGIREDMQPGCIAIPDQIIDYSWGRAHSFYDVDSAGVEHAEFDPPYDEALRQQLLQSATSQGIPCIGDGCYGCTQGPRLESAAEVRRLQRDGCAIVGMTGMPEAGLAREAGLSYACVAVVVNRAAGLGPTGQGIHAQIEQAIEEGMARTHALLEVFLKSG